MSFSMCNCFGKLARQAQIVLETGKSTASRDMVKICRLIDEVYQVIGILKLSLTSSPKAWETAQERWGRYCKKNWLYAQ
jgi:hypothetical protein